MGGPDGNATVARDAERTFRVLRLRDERITDGRSALGQFSSEFSNRSRRIDRSNTANTVRSQRRTNYF